MAENKSLSVLRNHLANQQGNKSLSLRERKQALAEAREGNILLLDTSGSMGDIANGSQSRMDVLWTLVQQLRGRNIPFRVCEFSDTAQWSDGSSKPQPYSGTNLAGALYFLSEIHPKQITLITDGLPDSIDAALEAASSLQCPISVLYVGPDSDSYTSLSAQKFCRDLSAATGGRYEKNSLASDSLMLASGETVRLMLTSGKEQINL